VKVNIDGRWCLKLLGDEAMVTKVNRAAKMTIEGKEFIVFVIRHVSRASYS
jgi:hypothetical protein